MALGERAKPALEINDTQHCLKPAATESKHLASEQRSRSTLLQQRPNTTQAKLNIPKIKASSISQMQERKFLTNHNLKKKNGLLHLSLKSYGAAQGLCSIRHRSAQRYWWTDHLGCLRERAHELLDSRLCVQRTATGHHEQLKNREEREKGAAKNRTRNRSNYHESL
jgi:hypothetical protein